MEEFGRTDLPMDLNLNLRPPSPPPAAASAPAPHLGLGLALASANNFISRPPDLISPRFEPRTSQPGFGDPEPAFAPSAEENHQRMASGRNTRSRWRRLRSAPAAESSSPAEENREISKAEEPNQGANFDCNICLAMAGEPVVTSCGHLFCWPCLYRWLHVHSASNECPVCKGEVTDLNITPIYGRGVKPSAGECDFPPRPHGRRVEGSRHRRRTSRPFSRRVEEILRLRNGRGRAEGFDGAEPREAERIEDLIGAVSDRIMHGVRFDPGEGWDLRERIIGRRSRVRSAAPGAHVIINEVEGRTPGGLEAGEALRDLHLARRFRADRLVAIRTRIESMEGMLQTLTGGNPHHPASASVPLHLPAAAAAAGVLEIPAAGQPGFEDNVPAPGVVRREIGGEEAVVLERGSGRRMMDVHSGGAAASGSSVDVDGGLRRARKIRRLN